MYTRRSRHTYTTPSGRFCVTAIQQSVDLNCGHRCCCIAISSAQRLGISELWIAFGTGKHFRFLPIHEIADTLGPQKCMALPFFHSLTGCDTVSFFGKSKKTACNTWKSYDSVTPAFCALANTPSVQCIENGYLFWSDL